MDLFKKIRAGVHETAQGFGFSSRRNVFFKDYDETYHLIDLQKSSRSSPNLPDFTLNVGIFCKKLYDPEFDDLKKMRAGDGHLQWRIGDFDVPRRDIWWAVSTEIEAESALNEIRSLLVHHAIPFLNQLLTTTNVVEYFEAGNYGGNSELSKKKLLADLRPAETG